MLPAIIDRRLLSHFDWPLLICILAVPIAGLVVLYSAGYDREAANTILGLTVNSPAFVRQLAFLGVGLIIMTLAMTINTKFFYRWAYLFYLLCLALLIGTLLFGDASKGARRWLSLGGLRFQPSEPMKLALILALSRFVSQNLPEDRIFGLKQLILPALMIAVPMLLVIAQPDLGTGLVIGATGFLLILFVGIRPRVLFSLIFVGVAALYPAWHFLKPYQQDRLRTLIDPGVDPRGTGYHVIQSTIAVGSGSLMGKGYFKGTQTQLEFLPEHSTDFIFSVLAEEWGFVGCLFVLFLYSCLLFRILRVVGESTDLFSCFVTFSVGALFFFHIVVNTGMVIGILPVVGITLPLFSYGGSSVNTFMFCLGLVLGVSVRRWLFIRNS